MITQERLKKLLHYDPETGVFTRLDSKCQTVHRNKKSKGYLAKHGYRKIGAGGKQYYAHRLAWLYMTGAWPVHQLDHKNGIREDNRWSNLREAVQRQNSANMLRRSTNKIGLKGVSRHKNKFIAFIHLDGKSRYLGLHSTPEQAHEAYLTAAQEAWGEFARAS